MANNTNFEEAPFNMAMLFYTELSNLRKSKSQAFINGEMNVYKDCLEEIYCMISFRITPKDKTEIENKFINVAHQFNNPEVFHLIKATLRDIDMKLISVMNRNGMIFPTNKTNGLKELEKRYIKK